MLVGHIQYTYVVCIDILLYKVCHEEEFFVESVGACARGRQSARAAAANLALFAVAIFSIQSQLRNNSVFLSANSFPPFSASGKNVQRKCLYLRRLKLDVIPGFFGCHTSEKIVFPVIFPIRKRIYNNS